MRMFFNNNQLNLNISNKFRLVLDLAKKNFSLKVKIIKK